jgi:hypothetical protein
MGGKPTKPKNVIKKQTSFSLQIKKNIPIVNIILPNIFDFDISIKMESLNELLTGWDVKYGNNIQKIISLKNEKVLLLGLLGMKNSGKSYVLSKLINDKVYKKEENDNLYLKYKINERNNSKIALIDTPGFKRAIKERNGGIRDIKALEKSNNQIDNFIMNFVLKKCNIIIYVSGYLNNIEQTFIDRLKLKDEEHKIEFHELKKLFIIHNLKDLSSKEDITEYINNVLLKSISFKLIEKDTPIAQSIINTSNNTKFFIEKNNNKELEIYHLILAKENSEAGLYYNEFTFNFISNLYNSFTFLKTFDIIKELKEEIQIISNNIFNKPIISLDDFDKSNNKIKLNNNYELIRNKNDKENADFSYLTLRPKYSYFKINNGKQLKIVIEMAGQIKDLNFACSKPKNGYYSMTFSGKRVLNVPNDCETQKKKGTFFTNIQEGEFSETIKIDINDFQLKSPKPNKTEISDGIYTYYFDIMQDSNSSDED